MDCSNIIFGELPIPLTEDQQIYTFSEPDLTAPICKQVSVLQTFLQP